MRAIDRARANRSRAAQLFPGSDIEVRLSYATFVTEGTMNRDG